MPFFVVTMNKFLYDIEREKGGVPVGNQSKKEIMFERMKERKKEVKTIRKIVLIISIVLFLILGIVGLRTYNYVKSALKPVDENSTEIVNVTIPMGSGITLISSILEEKGIIKDKRIFKYYVKFKNESDFQAGDYQLTKAMTFDELIESLKTGKVYREPVFTLTIPEGLTLDQIASVIEKNTEYKADEFMALVTSETFVANMMAKYPSLISDEVLNENIRYDLEGYLYPATYPFFEENPTLEQIVEAMISEMDKLVTEYSEAIAAKNLTVHQFLTFASLIEEEATAKTDRETIASVFYNRLEANMPLQTDPTVLYALGTHKDRVLYSDLEVDHPYNTYKNLGLPPGPIAGAGKISLEATLNPTDTDYLYFLADKDGVNHFAKTYEEHLANVAKYIQ